ncbi:MAG: preprotein translocase subunit SecE [Chitinophagales bacterium]|nr:preprotein translocase subunit SecE [Bacteroidota bacterium]MCB9042454.1 preprotein translocase subunit SecE [Chitinophagales bacterium]
MEKLKIYFQESYHELMYKVTWPTWEELQSSTVLVLVALGIFSLVIFVMDFIFGANPENTLFEGMLGLIYRMFA